MNNKLLWRIIVVISALAGTLIYNLASVIIFIKVWAEGKIYIYPSFKNPDALFNLAPMVRDVLDGHLWVSDGRTYEYISAPSLWSFLDPIIISPLTLAIRYMPYVFFFGRAIFVFAGFLIFYLLILNLIGKKVFSLLFTLFFFTVPYFGSYLFPARIFNIKLIARTFSFFGSYPGEIFTGLTNSFGVFPTMPFMVAALLFIYLALTKSRKIFVLISGILLGLLAYMYLTHAMYVLAALSITLLISAIRKDWVSVKKIYYMGLVSLVTASFYLVNIINIRTLPYADELVHRLGGDFTHAFRWSWMPEYLFYILAAILVWKWSARYRNKETGSYLAGLMLAPIILLNLQVITGYNPAVTTLITHQFIYGFAFFWAIMFFWIYDFARRKGGRKSKIVSAIFIVLFLLAAARIVQTNFYMAFKSYSYKGFAMPENLAKSFKWLEENTPRDSVVASPSLVTNALVPVFTANRVIFARALTSPVPLWEILDRQLLTYTLYGVKPDYLEILLKQILPGDDSDFAGNAENGTVGNLYEYWLVGTGLDDVFHVDPKLEESEINKIMETYKHYPKRTGFLLNRYRLDYLYVGPYERKMANRDFSKLKFLEKVYDDDGVQIYAVSARN